MTTGFFPIAGRDVIVKDPDAKLAYGLGWSGWLPAGDTIVSAAWTISPSGAALTVNEDKSGPVGAIAYVFLEGGEAGQTYTATCHVVTAAGLEDDRSFDVRCEER